MAAYENDLISKQCFDNVGPSIVTNCLLSLVTFYNPANTSLAPMVSFRETISK